MLLRNVCTAANKSLFCGLQMFFHDVKILFQGVKFYFHVLKFYFSGLKILFHGLKKLFMFTFETFPLRTRNKIKPH